MSDMSQGRYTDDVIREQLTNIDGENAHFVYDDSVWVLDRYGQPWAVVIEVDDLAEATVNYLRRRGQVRDALPVIDEFKIDSVPFDPKAFGLEE